MNDRAQLLLERDAAIKAKRHARHVATYIPRQRPAAQAGICKVCGGACGPKAKTCSVKCRKRASRKRQRIAAERRRLGLA